MAKKATWDHGCPPCAESGPDVAGTAGRGKIVAERNRYFTGKFMAARDFQQDQAYFLSRMHLHHRLFHGWGIVCGLEVGPHPLEHCPDWVVIRAGIALDPFGRLAVLHEDTPVRVVPEDDEGSREPHLLCLHYCEQEVEKTPAIFSEDCNASAREANRIREGARFSLQPWSDVPEPCRIDWLRNACEPPRADEDREDREPCDARDSDPCYPEPACIHPDAPCGDCVPLALISYPDGCHSDEPYQLHLEGRRKVARDAEPVTRIKCISWPHGGTVDCEWLQANSELEIRFEHPVREESHPGRGVNEYTFQVRRADRDDDIRPEELLRGQVRLSDNGKKAVFVLDPKSIKNKHDYFITLRCDFIKDYCGRPVDGNHLCGEQPTGDRRPGGTFESWVRVDNEHCDTEGGNS